MKWLVEKDIVQALLRAHLHQRQYVDQVQRVLKILAAEGGFQSDHLELLWALTEKARHSPAQSLLVMKHFCHPQWEDHAGLPVDPLTFPFSKSGHG